MRLAVMSAALLALAGCAADDRPCKLALATELPFRAASGHIYVQVLINGKKANFILDTGAEYTTLITSAVARLGLSDEAIFGAYVEGIGGARGARRTSTRQVQVGRLVGTDFSLLVADMRFPPTTPPTDGLMGMDFLYNYDVDINWPGRRVLLYKKLQGCTRPSAVLGAPLYPLDLLPGDTEHPSIRFPVSIDGKNFTAELDTGAPQTVMFRHAAERLGLTRALLAADPHAALSGVGPRAAEAARHVLEPITLGDLTIQHAPVAVVDQNLGNVDLLIGLPFTQRVHVWISNSSHTLIMQYPPRGS